MSQRHGKHRACSAWALVWVTVMALSARAVAQEEGALVSLDAVLLHADTHAPLLMLARARLEEGTALEEGAERLLSAPLRADVGVGPRFADATGEDFDVLVSLMQPLEIAGERGLRQRTRKSRNRRQAGACANARAHREATSSSAPRLPHRAQS